MNSTDVHSLISSSRPDSLTRATRYAFHSFAQSLVRSIARSLVRSFARSLDRQELTEEYLASPVVPREINYLATQSPNLLGYYGSNLPRLIDIKTKYDPQNYWQNPLSVPSNVDGTFLVPDVAVADTNGDGVVDASDAEGGGAVVAPGTVTAGGVMTMAGKVKVVVGVLVVGFAL